MSQLPPVHRTSRNRDLASVVIPRAQVTRPGHARIDKRSLAISMVSYFASIAVIGWFVITDGKMTTGPSRDEALAALAENGSAPGRVLSQALAQEEEGGAPPSAPAPAPTTVPAAATSAEDDAEFWGSTRDAFWDAPADQVFRPGE